MVGTATAAFLSAAQCNIRRWCGRWTPEEGRMWRNPAVGSLARGPPQVPCSSWCCESGRHQSENGYFTTPGSHRTTVRPPAGEERRFLWAGRGSGAGDVEHLPATSARGKGNQVPPTEV
nr:uncharacterized protein LOC110364334 [Columba livia]